MLDAAIRRPAFASAGLAPYPERGEDEANATDRLITEAMARLLTRLPRRRGRLLAQCAAVERLDGEIARLSELALGEAIAALRAPLHRRGFEPALVTRAFALLREMSARRIGLKPYPVQILAGLALMEGALAEMKTGEGKTITAALPAATAALAGLPTHVITVNDYLADRDATLLRPIYAACGLSVGIIQGPMGEAERRAAYACDITYAVNKEIAFDYLRDRLAVGTRRSQAARTVDRLGGGSAQGLLLRGLCFGILDEADSILIDDARTPLIIAGADGEASPDLYATALLAAGELTPGTAFRLVERGGRTIEILRAGSDRLAATLGDLGGLWAVRRAREEIISQALAARHLFARDKHYVVMDGKVQIVDESTGRVAEGRAWQNGLHQMIEAKEGCPITERRATRASITYQRFFRRYLHLSGMSGTLAEVRGELRAVYGLRTIRIPTHRPERRAAQGVSLFATRDDKWRGVCAAMRAELGAGRPVLVGTATVEASEALASVLAAAAIPHVVLNATHDREEAAIVAAAGQSGRVTVATNMAGRGTDIVLGQGVAKRGGLHVILTEFHASRRIDRQFIGRGARQGDPGSFAVFCALEDELFTTYAPRLARLIGALSGGRGRPAAAGWASLLRRVAQARAGRVLGRIRRQTARAQRDTDRALGFAWRE